MAEVDDILLGVLRQQLGCDIPDDITSVRLLSTEMLVEAVAKCLRHTDPEANGGIPLRLSAAMATKYRQASVLAEACKNAGFSGDLGYEAFLYGGEGETRKLLMFLVDKLPKEETTSVEAPAHGNSFATEVRNRLREEMERPWLPLALLQFRASRHSTSVDPRASVFRSQKLSVPLSLQQAQLIPLLPTQCSTSAEFGSSVIEYNALKLASWDGSEDDLEKFRRKIGRTEKNREVASAKQKPLPSPRIKPPVPARRRNEVTVVKAEEDNKEGPKPEITMEEKTKGLNDQLQELCEKVAVLLAEKASASTAILKAEKAVREGEEYLADFERTIAVKETIASASSEGSRLTVASVTGEIEDLQAMLVDLHEQWDTKKASLLQGAKSPQVQQNTTEKLQEDIRETKQHISSFHSELNEREEYLQVLQREYEKLGSLPTRAPYTKRILEIVASIKKQKVDIDKIIKDTRVIQKEINTLSGRLERAFIEIDELMFRDAKNDEFVRKAYKRVAMFHETCAGLIRTVESTGVLMRERKDLEDEAASVINRKVDEKLKNVLQDLKAIKEENASLETARHGQGLL